MCGGVFPGFFFYKTFSCVCLGIYNMVDVYRVLVGGVVGIRSFLIVPTHVVLGVVKRGYSVHLNYSVRSLS